MSAPCRWLARLLSVSLLIAADTALPQSSSFEPSREERFAAAFGLDRPAKDEVCAPWFRWPPGRFDNSAAETGAIEPALPGEADDLAGLQDPPSLPPPRFLRSIGIPVLNTQYDARWRKVREAGLSADCARHVLGSAARPETLDELLTFNRIANERIRYVEDGRSGREDDWAIASHTLGAGTGDCEDIAILKFQLLLALGVAEDDLYFALVRDLMRGRDHAVVVMRSADRLVLLDSLSNLPANAATEQGYVPVVAFSGDRKWLLGEDRQAAIVPSMPRRRP